ncbi:hypothetical protein [Rhodococcus sp. ARC_M6]|uniref:hypothetical protein n=1 Tax=Rhodococcus sp. ARC_M6 TaxID=2928852 RepID=UPI001FB42BF1|nr:hypothetical protein [Rhodococcus sp. ARC_M6]MCJ0903854.1 hypothetical protein [Rhodococcus sp. ARC_M6]
MLYLLALVGLVTLAVLMWKAFGPSPSTRTPVGGVRGPDDDPEFLWNVNQQTRRKQNEGPDTAPTDPSV